jgi:hypothetical protein
LGVAAGLWWEALASIAAAANLGAWIDILAKRIWKNGQF